MEHYFFIYECLYVCTTTTTVYEKYVWSHGKEAEVECAQICDYVRSINEISPFHNLPILR